MWKTDENMKFFHKCYFLVLKSPKSPNCPHGPWVVRTRSYSRCGMSTSFCYKRYIKFNINNKCTTSEHKSIRCLALRVVYLHINKRIYAWIWFNESWFTCAVTLESCALDSSCSNALFSKTLCARVKEGCTNHEPRYPRECDEHTTRKMETFVLYSLIQWALQNSKDTGGTRIIFCDINCMKTFLVFFSFEDIIQILDEIFVIVIL